MRRICVCLSMLLLACGQKSQHGGKHLNAAAFRELMDRLADGWSQQKTDQAVACFTENAIYMEPPDIQFYKGHSELRPYFAALKPGTFMRFHNLWFDEARQIGAGEYSFSEMNETTADHGIVVVELRDGRIAFGANTSRKDHPHLSGFSTRRINLGGGRSKIIRKMTNAARTLLAVLFRFN